MHLESIRRNLALRQKAMSAIIHLAVSAYEHACEDIFLHLNYVSRYIF